MSNDQTLPKMSAVDAMNQAEETGNVVEYIDSDTGNVAYANPPDGDPVEEDDDNVSSAYRLHQLKAGDDYEDPTDAVPDQRPEILNDLPGGSFNE